MEKISYGACSRPNNTSVLVLSLNWSFYGSSKINHRAQLEFCKVDDVFVTSHDVMFAIVELLSTSVVPPRLLGQ